MKKWLKYILISMLLFIGVNEVDAKGNMCPSNNINTSNWQYMSTESSSDAAFLGKDIKTNSTLVKCCKIGAGDTLRYYCDTYAYIGKPEDNQISGTNENEDTNISCSYDLTGYSFSYNQSSNSDITNKISNSIICCKQSSHVGGSSQYSCNVYTSDRYIETQNKNENILGPVGSCDDLGETIDLIRQIYNLLKYAIPVVVIILSVIDFLKVIINGEEKVFNEAWKKFITRIVVGIIILILPILLSFVINISGVLENYEIDGNNIFCIFR